jgi:hypothetical protein
MAPSTFGVVANRQKSLQTVLDGKLDENTFSDRARERAKRSDPKSFGSDKEQ